jgi:biopolymer transport protein ExbD
MRGRGALFIIAVVSTACAGGEPPPRPPESTAFIQDPARPNIVYGIEGAVEGAPEIGLKDGREVTLDGAKVADADPKTGAGGLARALSQRKSPSGRIACAFDRDAPWAVVRGLLDTAAKAGYPHASLVTRVVKGSVAHPGHLDVEIATEKKATTDRQLHVTLSARGAVMLKWSEGSKQIGDVVSADAAVTRLAPHVEREWNGRGLYHEPNDQRVDQIMLHVEPDAPYILVITVLDAVSATKRNGAPACVLNLPFDDKAPVPTIGSKPR